MTDQRIAQRFSVHATLEESKLGTLFLTTDEERGAPALLLLLATATQSDDATLQAIVADQLTAPHVLATYAFGRTDEAAWLATDAPALTADAATLEAVLKRRDRLELAQLLRLAVALARGVEALSTGGKQHLDIQPNRVWLDTGALTTGAPQLFGIGWWRLLPAYSTTASAEAFYGNPEYLAAELCKGQPASATADVYGAATTLWAIAAGKPPFPSNQPLMALKRQAVEKPLRLDLVKPALQGVKDLQAVVAEALDKEPAKRPSPTAWRALVEALAAQKAADVLDQSQAPTAAAQAPASVAAPAPERIADAPAATSPTPVDLRGTMQFTGADVAAALAAAVASAEGPTAQAPMDDAAALASLPEVLAAGAEDGDDDDEGAEGAEGAPRQGRRRRERRERQTVAGIGIAAALAEANLADQKSGGPGLAGLTPNSTPSLTGIARPDSAPAGAPPSPLSAVPAAPSKPTPHGKKVDAAPPKRPDSQASQKVIVNQPAKGPSNAAVARTGRSLTVQLAEGAFFDEDAVAPSAAADLGDQVPPVPPKEKLNRKALLAIATFAALMLGVSLWMSQHSPLPDGPTQPETPPATDEAALEPAADATTAVAAPAVEPTPVAAAAALTPTAVAPAPVEAAPVNTAPVNTAPDAGNAADTAVAPALVPIDAAHQAEVQRLVAEGNSALMTKDPVTALAKAQEALKVNAGHAPALLLKEQAQKGVDAAIAEAKAAEAKAAEIKAAEAQAAASKAEADAVAKSAATARREQKAQSKREAQKAAVSRAQALKAERLAAAKEASAAKAKAARERAAAKKAEKDTPAKKTDSPVKKTDSEATAKKSDKEASTRAPRPDARPVEKPVDDGNSASQEASKFAALAQKASKAKLKVLYLQKAVKLDPANAGYKSQLKAADEQLKTEGP